MISDKWIYYACGYIALLLVVIAIFPKEGDQIQRAGIGLLFVIIGLFSAFKPEQVRANMAARQLGERSRKSVEGRGLWFFRYMGIAFAFGGAYALFNDIPLSWLH